MINLLRDAWGGVTDVFLGIATGALDATLTIYNTMAALPLPFAVMTVAAGAALFHTLDQRAARRGRHR
jgi:hypothetical protein